ncbi:hypothetical protein [Pseudoglutamicibacter cumminsii]|uniref:hypothetical protein n=1 Tax=Pseudoglutamicibacter cumminsii TaxID=156979 RepID=UPI001EF8B0F8|nr:hypothetical protein [Pseudoglutamicibacter cumminsii]MBM7795793.1 hypothetical protein [Pseudoglutamicibacter cumminsii]
MATPLNRIALLAAYRYYQQETANLDVEQLEFSPYLYVALLDKGAVAVEVDDTVTFRFRDGREQEITISPK